MDIEQEVEAILELERRIEETEDIAKTLKQQKLQAEERLAEKMLAANQISVRTRKGYIVKVKEDVRGTWPKDRAEDALQWLETRQAGDVVKTEVVATFLPGFVDEAKRAAQQLARHNAVKGVTVETRVHPQTLAALLRELLAEGKVDQEGMDLFSVFTRLGVSIKEA